MADQGLQPTSKSYLPNISSLSPWGSRSVTPTQAEHQRTSSADGDQGRKPAQSSGGSDLPPGNAQRGGDHSFRMRRHSYLPEVPTAEVRWFHAVDVPKRKPVLLEGRPTFEKLKRTPKKFVPFSKRDSRAIENKFQQWSEEDERSELGRNAEKQSKKAAEETADQSKPIVPVNEDYLFDVDVLERELRPAYWDGLVYEVRRGLWFNSDGSVIEENLSSQLEDGYLKVKPWKLPTPQPSLVRSKSKSRPTSWQAGGAESTQMTRSKSDHAKTSEPLAEDSGTTAQALAPEDGQAQVQNSLQPEPELNQTHRLFGSHMNSVVTYQDSTTAWLLTDDFLSRMSSTMYQRFAGGGHFAGVKLTRGFVDTKKRPEKAAGETKEQRKQDSSKSDEPSATVDSSKDAEDASPESEKRMKNLKRQMSSLVESGTENDPSKMEEELLKREEQEMQEDYKDEETEDQGRQIEHLILVTHGIGQRLGMRMESINFIHDVNTFRKTFKSVYGVSTDLQTLNSEVQSTSKNCRIQVLPVVWRNQLDFPKQSLKHNRQELDLGDASRGEDDEYPSLDDITVDGVPAVRGLITDLALDVLLYQSPAYKGHISRIVVEQANKIYHLFKQRNPNFQGRVSLVGHSLGSAIMFDLLCRQRADDHHQYSSLRRKRRAMSQEHKQLAFDFDVEDFYALGSPIGLFQMLKGRTIVARQSKNEPSAESPDEDDETSLGNDPFGRSSSPSSSSGTALTATPKCERLFNIFHPTDPVSYRIEPLISPAMAALKPQPLPYTKRGIFGAPVGQGITGIGARVGQSISGMWSNVSSSLASSMLNRSLGITGVDHQSSTTTQQGSATGASARHAQLTPAQLQQYAEGDLDVREGDDGLRPPLLIDADIQTLYAGFQQRRPMKSLNPLHPDNNTNTVSASDAEQKDEEGSSTTGAKGNSRPRTATTESLEQQSRRLRREEAKVLALNSNGRVDYSIQEGAFDISLLASIASHLSYWSDEDVVHFMVSQLLARHRVIAAGGDGKGASRS